MPHLGFELLGHMFSPPDAATAVDVRLRSPLSYAKTACTLYELAESAIDHETGSDQDPTPLVAASVRSAWGGPLSEVTVTAAAMVTPAEETRRVSALAAELQQAAIPHLSLPRSTLKFALPVLFAELARERGIRFDVDRHRRIAGKYLFKHTREAEQRMKLVASVGSLANRSAIVRRREQLPPDGRRFVEAMVLPKTPIGAGMRSRLNEHRLVADLFGNALGFNGIEIDYFLLLSNAIGVGDDD